MRHAKYLLLLFFLLPLTARAAQNYVATGVNGVTVTQDNALHLLNIGLANGGAFTGDAVTLYPSLIVTGGTHLTSMPTTLPATNGSLITNLQSSALVGPLPAISGAALTALPATATVQGNTFNGVSQLLQLDGAGKVPAVDGSQLTNLPIIPPAFNNITSATNTTAAMVVGTGAALGTSGSGIITANGYNGTANISDGALSANIPLLNAHNTFTVAPQTITSDNDTHTPLVLNGHSATQSANLLTINDGFAQEALYVLSDGTMQLYPGNYTNPVTNAYGIDIEPYATANPLYAIYALPVVNPGTGNTNAQSIAIYADSSFGYHGTITQDEAVHARFGVTGNASQTITNAIGVHITPEAQTGGTITNLYSIYIEPKTAGGTVTNYYGIYQSDTAASNLLAGPTTFSSSATFNSNLTVTSAGHSTTIYPTLIQSDRINLSPINGAQSQINIYTTADALADTIVTPSATTQKAFVEQALPAQSANLHEWNDSTNTVMAAVGPTGVMTSAVGTANGNVLTTDGTQTVTNKSIAASQLTGSLPAISGSALTSLPSVRGAWLGTTYLTLTGSNTFTTSGSTNHIKVRLIGGGGGGGGVSSSVSSAAVGGGGGSGGYAERAWVVTPNTGYTYVINTGGGGGANTGGNGTAGGSVTFTNGATVTANGGAGGIGQAFGSTNVIVLGGAGAAISTSGDYNTTGSPGGYATRISASVGASGFGASSLFGGGGNSLITSGVGNAGTGHGSGGGGACQVSNGGANAGGAGTNGLIIVDEFE